MLNYHVYNGLQASKKIFAEVKFLNFFTAEVLDITENKNDKCFIHRCLGYIKNTLTVKKK